MFDRVPHADNGNGNELWLGLRAPLQRTAEWWVLESEWERTVGHLPDRPTPGGVEGS